MACRTAARPVQRIPAGSCSTLPRVHHDSPEVEPERPHERVNDDSADSPAK
jgi:hypothetical protein